MGRLHFILVALFVGFCVSQGTNTPKGSIGDATSKNLLNSNSVSRQQKLKISPPTQNAITQEQNPIYCPMKIFNKTSINNQRRSTTTTRQYLISTVYGFDMYVDSKDGSVSQRICYLGTWEPQNIKLIGKIVKPGHNVLNLGSQSGLEAIIMGKIVGPTGKLFIFQPYSFSNMMVTKNIELNNLKNITTIYKMGASDETSSGQIAVQYSNTGGSQITVPTKKSQNINPNLSPRISQSQEVKVDKVDNILPQNISLDFALIDVQKMQIKALNGMKKIIDRSPNFVIMTEWQYLNNQYSNQGQAMDLLNYFLDKKYKIYLYNGSSGGNLSDCRIGNLEEIKDVNVLFRMTLGWGILGRVSFLLNICQLQ